MAKVKSRQSQKSFEWRDLFEGPRKWFVITPACLLLVAGGWWAYVSLTALPPAEVSKGASVEEVVNYVSDPRGLIRLSVPQREQYLVRTWQAYAQSTPEQRARLMQQIDRMTPNQQRVFAEAVTGGVTHHVLEGANQYRRLRTASERQRFAQQFYNDFQKMRNEVTGAGTLAPGMNVTKPLAAVAPTKSEDLQKVLITQTTPAERAKAGPFVEKLVDIHKQEILQKVHGG